VPRVAPLPLSLTAVSYPIYGTAPTAHFFRQKTCKLILKGNIQNFPGFMILRQLTIVFSFFVVGAITGLNNKEGEGNTIFRIQYSAQKFLNFGFHGAVITTILASISLQLAALAFPIDVMVFRGCVPF
jgi:hypothetical protein